MRQWLRSHLTYANVMVTVLAFIVLTGGTAVALNGSNTVFTDDIANDNFTSPTEGQGGLVAADLRANSVAASEVLNRSLGQAEFAKSIPAVHVTHSVNQTVPFTNPSVTTLAFDTERYDTANMHDNATNNSRLTAPVNGIYAVTAQVSWSPNGTGVRDLELRKNGTTDIDFDESALPDQNQEVTTQVRLAAGDYVEALVQQATNPQVTLNIEKFNETSPEFSMTWLAPGP